MKHQRREDHTTLCGAVEFDSLDGIACSLCKTLHAVRERAASEGRALYTVEDVQWVLEEHRKALKAKVKE